MVKCTGRGLVVKRPGVLSKVQMLNLVLGVGSFPFFQDKAHKHKHIFTVTARVRGGSPDRVARGLPTGGQGSKVYVLCAEPKEHKHFRPGARPGGSGARPGGSVTGVTETVFMCQMFMCLFRPLEMIIFKTDEFHG